MKHLVLLFSALLFVGISTAEAQTQKMKESGEKGGTNTLVASKSGKISSKMSAKLLNAFNQSFKGYKAYKVTVSPGKGGGDLAFMVNDKVTSHVLIPCLDRSNEGFVLGPIKTGIRNCNKGDGCTQCKTPCGCGRNGGNGSCVEVVTNNLKGMGAEFMTLLGY